MRTTSFSNENEENPTDRDLPFMLPVGTKKRWTEEEEGLIPIEGNNTLAYQTYLANCFEARIPARTFTAFRKRRDLIIGSLEV